MLILHFFYSGHAFNPYHRVSHTIDVVDRERTARMQKASLRPGTNF